MMVTQMTGESSKNSTSQFEFTGGNLALDFVNTVSKRRCEEKEELLLGCADFVEWATQAGVMSAPEARSAIRHIGEHPRQAAKTLQDVIKIRETIFRIFSPIACQHSPSQGDLQALSAKLKVLSSKAELVWRAIGPEWQWCDSEEDAVAKALWLVIRSAVELLMSGDRERVRQCEATTCAWLFMDHSKNQSRRWCDMKICGNREKAKRFYERTH
jgi:predicted RNA-binding Zn ribbon-like protein